MFEMIAQIPAMPRRSSRCFVQATKKILVLAISLGFGVVCTIAKDRSKPTTPGNFRVTGKTAYSVTVAWNASSDNSGNFNYHLSGAYHVPPAILPKTATTHTFTNLAPGNDYWFFIYAKDAAGNVSGQATCTTRTLLDTTPPWTAPVVTVNEVGSTYAKISWTPAQDDGHYWYSEVWVNGSLHANIVFPKSVTSLDLRFLTPDTTYVVEVRGYDAGGNRSPFSEPAVIRTLPTNPADTTPPTVPAFVNAHGFGDGSTETHVSWGQSTDDFDAQANIRYDVYVNGRREDVLFGSGGPRIIYSDFGPNLIEVTATDTAGNTSVAATTTIFF